MKRLLRRFSSWIMYFEGHLEMELFAIFAGTHNSATFWASKSIPGWICRCPLSMLLNLYMSNRLEFGLGAALMKIIKLKEYRTFLLTCIIWYHFADMIKQ